ncbi:MAG: His/Gly/Thr/Pro-type tRNA ligase C-terminal domain-containing protein, partial [Nitrospirota bacterium]|nr:His/Gly/Thr/Pro-type tRNA ligase C-terminal domain-containing protein [Nitrospirota bacterium]
YDNLVEELGGPSTPAIGFSIGMERLVTLFDSSSIEKTSSGIFIAALGDAAQEKAFSLLTQLHRQGIQAVMDYNGGSLKSQMRKADKLNAGQVLIIGEDELAKGIAILRNMKNKMQTEVLFLEIAQKLSGVMS